MNGWIDTHDAALTLRPNDTNIVDAALTAAYSARGERLLSIACDPCGGGRRAMLGHVFASAAGPILAIEVSLTPAPALDCRGELPQGWHHRGEPHAPHWIVALDDEWSDDATLRPYCASLGRLGRHGVRALTVGTIRERLERPTKRRILAT